MPQYVITGPDGNKYRVTAPDSATESDVLSYVQKNAAKPDTAEADSTGFGEAMLIGTGRMADKLVQGVKQGYNQLTGNKDALAAQKAEQDAADEQYGKLAKARPWATGLGEAVPLLAVPALGTVRATMGAAAIPGLVGYGDTKEKLTNAAVGAGGAGVGMGVGKALGTLLSKPAVSESQQLARDAAGRLNVDLRADELSGNRPLKWATTALNDLPISGTMAQRGERARETAINQAAARAMGQQADEITPRVFEAARQDTGATFGRILNPLRVELDNTFRAEVKTIVGSKVMRELRDESVDALLAPFQNMPAGKVKVSGEWFQQNKTALDDAIRSAYTGNMPAKAKALEQFEKALDRAATRSMSTAEREAYTTAQRQWAALRLLETGNVVEAGKVAPGRLKEALRARYKDAYKEGRLDGELADIARLGETFKPLPQSGTTPRAAYSGMAGGVGMVDPVSAGMMMGGPAAAQWLLQSPMARKVAADGLADLSPTTRNLLTYGGGLLGLAGAGAARP
jgi:hypothetical protein